MARRISEPFGALVAAFVLAGTVGLAVPGRASACVGGMEFGWAVGHTRGWIATATVASVQDVPVGFYRLELRGVDRVRGGPPSLAVVTVAMGAVCEQEPRTGDTLLLLDDIDITPAYDTPVAYVIRGVDAVPAAEVARALAMPATDAAGAPGEAAWSGAGVFALLVAVGAAAFGVTLRRSRRTGSSGGRSGVGGSVSRAG